MYSRRALEERGCIGIRKNGKPCRAYAVWGDINLRCAAHGGRRTTDTGRERPPNCSCYAYRWPHRPGGGLCRWPDPPEQSSRTRQGTRSAEGEKWKQDKKLARRFGIDPDELRHDPTLAPLLKIYALLSRTGGK